MLFPDRRLSLDSAVNCKIEGLGPAEPGFGLA